MKDRAHRDKSLDSATDSSSRYSMKDTDEIDMYSGPDLEKEVCVYMCLSLPLLNEGRYVFKPLAKPFPKKQISIPSAFTCLILMV